MKVLSVYLHVQGRRSNMSTSSNIILFFPQKGAKNSQFAADCQSENFKYKNSMCNAQIPKDKMRGRVVHVVKQSLNKMLNKCKFP